MKLYHIHHYNRRYNEYLLLILECMYISIQGGLKWNLK